MSVRRKPRRQEAQLAFEALSIEGGLLSADWLARAAQLSAGSQGEADYRIPKGLNLRDEIGRYWRIAQAHWSEFVAGRAGGADPRALTERFVYGLLREGFGFASLALVAPAELEGRSYPIGALALGKGVPIVVAPSGSGLDTLSPAFGDGGRRRSAFGLAQEFLNASDDALWGITTDGITLRILRDNASLTRPSWIEADLASIFTEERYADFAALWLIAHETRFGAADRPPTESPLERWRSAGREEGTRAREHLRKGVEDALLALGQGFLSHPNNHRLRSGLETGVITRDALFQQLLRLVYRLLFLLTAEERDLLHEPESKESARNLYAHGYSIRRLRDRSVRRSGYDRFSDLWNALKIVLRGLARGEARLGLPALGGLFDEEQCVDLDAAELENRAFLLTVFRLSWIREEGSLARVNWRDMGPEELGSVYESLLELVPVVAEGGRSFSFATGAEARGNARKTTGSYYTPDSLVQVLLDSALEPVVATTIAENPGRTVEALLTLSIVDPACGSGHFLLSAARRLAAHVARIEANGTPSAEQYRHALRQVVGRCIFGVDLNPMAVELCKVSLWMEAVEPGRPLSFLDSHVQHGNALLGATPELLAKGVPDIAWDPIEGDEKKIASALKKQNKVDAKALALDFSPPPASTYARLGASARAVDDTTDEDLVAVELKETQWRALLTSTAYEHQRFVADVWCAAFVWRKEPGALRDLAPTEAVFRRVQRDSAHATLSLREEVVRLRDQYYFFHWHLAFPQVFARGGFDLVLGNPPWDQLQLDAREWFAHRAPDITNARHHAARTTAINSMSTSEPLLHAEFLAAKRHNEGVQSFLHASGRFPRTSGGRLNTAPLFAESAAALVRANGMSALVVPTGVATDSFTQPFFEYLVESRRLQQLMSFENEEFIFPAVHHATKFCVLNIGGMARRFETASLVFFARRMNDLRDAGRVVSLSRDDFRLFNPNSSTCPTFRWQRDADLNRRIYETAGVFVRDDAANGNPWGFHGLLMFMMNTDSNLFRTRSDLYGSGAQLLGNIFSNADKVFLPLIEAKMIHAFDHRFGTYDKQTDAQSNQGKLPELDDDDHVDATRCALPDYWVPRSDVLERVREKWPRLWLLGWRDICRSTDQRTVIPSVFPLSGVGHTMPLLLTTAAPQDVAALYANLSSFLLDYAARQKVGGTHLTYGYFKQLPIAHPDLYRNATPWEPGAPLREWILRRVLELTFTAWDLEPFARDVTYDGPPFRWDPARRFLLRCELDAAFFHLYGLSHADSDYVMGTFPIVRKNDEKAHGEYRTKRVILEIYDAMAEAARTGTPYATRLEPPPADPRVAHAPRTTTVVPFVRPAPASQPLPVWDADVLSAAASRAQVTLAAGTWTLDLGGQDLGTSALAAVLRHLPYASTSADVERAVVLILLPRLLQRSLPKAAAREWGQLVGANDLAVTSIEAHQVPWASVVRTALQQGILVVIEGDRWEAGPNLAEVPPTPLDARAIVALTWLATSPAADDEVSEQARGLRAA